MIMNKELEEFRDILGTLIVISGYEIDMNSEPIKSIEQALNVVNKIKKILDKFSKGKLTPLDCIDKIDKIVNK